MCGSHSNNKSQFRWEKKEKKISRKFFFLLFPHFFSFCIRDYYVISIMYDKYSPKFIIIIILSICCTVY